MGKAAMPSQCARAPDHGLHIALDTKVGKLRVCLVWGYNALHPDSPQSFDQPVCHSWGDVDRALEILHRCRAIVGTVKSLY